MFPVSLSKRLKGKIQFGMPLTHFVPHGPPEALSGIPRPPDPPRDAKMAKDTLQRLVPTIVEAVPPKTHRLQTYAREFPPGGKPP